MNVVFIAIGAAALAGGIVVWLLGGKLRTRAREGTRENLRLTGTVLVAFAALALVTGWLLTGGDVNRGDAVKTGGLAGGAIVALYALWLNDRRRRVDEERQDLERKRQALDRARAEHDRERAADERFLRAVELLGDAADQVRVGALHALAGLARARPSYTQDVLDVICSYLRRPFDHPQHDAIRGASETPDRDVLAEADRWRQVRLTAQRLIADLLPSVTDPDAKAYDLDLHGATLEYFDVSWKVIGKLRARELDLYESTSFHHCEIRGAAWFTGSRNWGRLYAQDVVFRDRAWFSRFTSHGGPADFARTAFHGETKFASSTWDDPVRFADAVFARNVDFEKAKFRGDLDLRVAGGLTGRTIGMTVSLRHQHDLPPGWHVDESRDETTGLVRS
jgi:pentapeptide repeat protein